MKLDELVSEQRIDAMAQQQQLVPDDIKHYLRTAVREGARAAIEKCAQICDARDFHSIASAPAASCARDIRQLTIED